MDLLSFGLAREAGIRNGHYFANDPVNEIEVIDAAIPITLAGVCLTGALLAVAAEGAAHTINLRFLAADESDVSVSASWGEHQVTLAPQGDGTFAGAFWIGLDGVAIPSTGAYSFLLSVDGCQIGEAAMLVTDAPNRANILLHSCVQDLQGKEAGDKYLIGRIRASVIARGRSSEVVDFTLKQTVGADFAVDPMEISVPKEYTDFLAVPEFREGVEQYYRQHAIADFGGNLDGAVDNIVMGANVIIAPPVLLQLQLPIASSNAW